MNDVVPALLEQIDKSFANLSAKDDAYQRLLALVNSGEITLNQVQTYARRIGCNRAEALLSALTAENLPDGKLYYNIAKRTITPQIEAARTEINTAARIAANAQNARAGINIKAVSAEFPAERVEAVVSAAADRDELDSARRLISEAVQNISVATVDDFCSENCEVAAQAGLRPTITRRIVSETCSWCERLAGTYVYGEHPAEVFMRHDGCNCEVAYNVGRLSQNAHTKTWRTVSTGDIATRRELEKMTGNSRAEAEAIEKALRAARRKATVAEREKRIQKLMDERGISHRSAAIRDAKNGGK